MTAADNRGRLLLMPNTLDLGAAEVPLTDVLAGGVITAASRLLHWVVEDARSARAFLNRVNKVYGRREAPVADAQFHGSIGFIYK